MAVALEEAVKTFDPERRARIEAMADCLLAGNQTLKDLRNGKEPPPEQVAKALNIQQAILVHQERMAEELDVEPEALNRYMHRSDVLLFLFQTYIDALDGELMVKIPRKRAVTLEKFNEPEDSTIISEQSVHPRPPQKRPSTPNEDRYTVVSTDRLMRQGS